MCNPSTRNRKVYASNRWKLLSEAKRRRDPLCEHCIEHGISTAATEAHHIVPISDAPWLAYEISNLLSLCVECHRAVDGQGDSNGGWVNSGECIPPR